MEKKKKFDAVAESRKWKAIVSERLQQMSDEEQTAYLNRKRNEYFASLEEPVSTRPPRKRTVRPKSSHVH